jgi:hypothetical protein
MSKKEVAEPRFIAAAGGEPNRSQGNIALAFQPRRINQDDAGEHTR